MTPKLDQATWATQTITVAADETFDFSPGGGQTDSHDSTPELYRPPDEECKRILQRFVKEFYYVCSGEKVAFTKVYNTFLSSLPWHQRSFWSRVRFTRSLPVGHSAGSGNGNRSFVINLSDKPLPPKDYVLYVDRRGRISKG